jgi:prevent-host-death family protein
MTTITATYAKSNFGAVLDETKKGPVIVQKNSRTVAVILSNDEYDRLTSLEDAYWVARAEQLDQNDYTGPEDSLKYLKELLDGDQATDKNT